MGGRIADRGRGLAAALAVLLLGLAGAAHAKDCSRATPLPADVAVTPPGADVPADLARFSGAWGGTWSNAVTVHDRPCVTVVVEQVFPNAFARVVYSHGTFEPFVPQPRYQRVAARIDGGVLRFELLAPTRPEVRLRVAGAHLDGTFREGDVQATMTATRIADVTTAACVRQPSPPPPSGASRDRLTATELLASAPASGLVHNDYFVPVGPALPARHALRGTLSVSASRLAGSWEGCAGLGVPVAPHALTFVTHGEHLVPVVRGIVPVPSAVPGAPPRGLIVSPGRVWSEPGDRGLSRASFPFVIVNAVENGTHNGLATFLFDDTRVSHLRVQLTQETNRWGRDDLWGQFPMHYMPEPIANEAQVRADFDDERRQETPIRPWSALPAAGTSPWLGAAFDGSALPTDISASGLVVDGVLYVKGCQTRTGPYPYCRHMRHGAFSVTKTLGAGVALLRLAAKYGDGVFDAKIADHVPVTAAHDGWKDVTFADALGMVVPIGDAGRSRRWPDPQPDETLPRLVDWALAPSAREKLAVGFGYGRHAWGRGEVVRYNSAVTFTLVAAMDAFLKQREGPDAHLWDMVVAEVFRPIGIFHAPTMHTSEPGGRRGLPILAHGLTPTIDDVAKLATLLQQRGRHGGAQILSAAKIDDALRPTDPGVSTLVPSRYGEQRYHLSFWSLPYETALGCRLHVPYMLGDGGNFVVLLPNGVSAFRFADGHLYDVETTILAAEAVRPFCTAAPARRPPASGAAQGPPLTAAELRAELVGHTFGTGGLRVFIAPDGVQFLSAGSRVDLGRWWIMPDGRYCRAWTVADSGLPRCHHVYRAGERFTFVVDDRWTVFQWSRTRGKPADL